MAIDWVGYGFGSDVYIHLLGWAEFEVCLRWIW